MQRFLLLATLLGAAAACPVQIASLCNCQTWLSGLQLNCSFTNFTEVTELLRELKSPVYQLIVTNSPVPTLSFDLLKTLSIRQLHFSDNNMAQVEEGALKDQSESLESLVINNNALREIPKLTNLVRLNRLDLISNHIEDVPDRIFSGNPRLQQLRLKDNKICTLSTNALNETKESMELLDLSNNCLRLIPAMNIRGAPRLSYLDLSSNQIADIPNLQFMNLPSLKEVRLNDNQIIGVKPLAFMNVPNLAHLFLRNNTINFLEPNRFQAFKKLEFLDLEGNSLKRIPSSSFKEIPSLQQIILDNNEIESIETLAFSANPKLRAISLRNNKLKQLFRNAFDSLPEMKQLDLENNMLEVVGPGQFAGMLRLQHLNLRGNNIAVIEPKAFETLADLTTLDLGDNALTSISKEAFSGLKKLFWLDLCCNGLQSLEDGAFTYKIANMLLHGNALVCDERLDWFVGYLVKNNVRTFLPNQPEVTCAAPADKEGTRLKDLMIQKANTTFFSKLKELAPGGANSQLPLGNLIPGLRQIPGLPNSGIPGVTGGIPGLNAMSQLFPDLGKVPVLSAFTNEDFLLPSDRADLLPALTDLTTPLSKIVSGQRPDTGDINDIVGSIPRLVQNIPGAPGMDISKVPPELIRHVMSGGQIPGVSRTVLDGMVRRYLQQMADAAADANAGRTETKNGVPTTTVLPPLTALPNELMKTVMLGNALPGLTTEQTSAIRDYYTTIATTAATGGRGLLGPTELLRLLSNEVDLSQLPPALLQRIAAGETISLSMIPKELVSKIQKANPELVARIQKTLLSPESVQKQPSLENRPFTDEFPIIGSGPSYNLDAVSSDVSDPLNTKKDDNLPLYTGIGLACVGAITLATVGYLCYRRRVHSDSEDFDRTTFLGSPKTLDSVVTQSNNNNYPPVPQQPPPTPHGEDYRRYAMNNSSFYYGVQ